MTKLAQLIQASSIQQLSDSQIQAIASLTVTNILTIDDAITQVESINRYKYLLIDKTCADILNQLSYDAENVVYSARSNSYTSAYIDEQNYRFVD